MKNKISMITIAKDEEKMIADCLKSALWAQEMILLDTGSRDKTMKMAQNLGAKVVLAESRERDFAAWHNQGQKAAKNDWIFYLDADERLTPELQKEILAKIKKSDDYSAFAVPRRNFLLRRPMKFGGWYPDYQIRLFKKDKLIRWEGKLHERPIFQGELGYLKNPMLHLTHRDLSSMVSKTNQWSVIEADLLFKAHHPPVTWWRILKIMMLEFWQRGVKKQGWRDGTVGWIEIIYQMFSRFITYARLFEKQGPAKGRFLWEKQNQKKRGFSNEKSGHL
ncbi:glycosyltransferase family 2 protein [Candidatus Shapirobacteria bacterium]|nr:glycosyltransferase family 2 protein [Candidatus Shapirobacteria bacterium]